MKAKKFLALALILAMLASLAAASALGVSAAEEDEADEGATAEIEPISAEIEDEDEPEDEDEDDAVEEDDEDEPEEDEDGAADDADEAEEEPGFEDLFEYFADDLKALGLFLGTDGGYELDRAPTRDEAATMLVRLLGKEAEAKQENNEHPFTDVLAWADPYVGYLYANGLTKGISDELFGSKDLCNAQMFCTFVLRALGYADTGDATDFTYEEAVAFAVEAGLVSEDLLIYSALEFTRAGCVYIMRMALITNIKGTETPLLAKLAADGAVSEGAAAIFFEKIGIKPEPKPEPEPEPEDEEEDEDEEDEEEPGDDGVIGFSEQEMQALIQTLSAGFIAGNLESNVGLAGLMELGAMFSPEAIEKTTKEVLEDGILWTIEIKSEAVEAVVSVRFDADNNFTELLAEGTRLGGEGEAFEIEIKAK